MGQSATCCSCGKNAPSNAPFHVITEPLPGDAKDAGLKALKDDPALSGLEKPARCEKKEPGAVDGGMQRNSTRESKTDDFDTLMSFAQSEGSYVASTASMNKDQKLLAKRLVKEFVQKMVKGRQFSVILPSGQVRVCYCALNRMLDKLQIRANEKDKHGRTVPLSTIAEIVVGNDLSVSNMCQSLETPVDDYSVTLMLDSEESITFRLDDMESRDKLAICLSMFSDRARDPSGATKEIF
mmetsp:Transcript_47527/g.75166  ORF Transcript_47527/g.75166 Transcript_47527/m.75166 type:complete len:239 (-) Transcript_47527:72-788(-)